MSDQHTVMTTTKSWYESRTLWVNALTVIAVILSFVLDAQMSGGLPLGVDPRYISLALGLINIFLRMDTVKPIKGGAVE